MSGKEKARSGGGATIARDGLTRCTREDRSSDPPEHYVVIDVDFTEAELRERYAGNANAQALISAAKQLRRNTSPPNERFLATLDCDAGIHEPVLYTPLGLDVHGEPCPLILGGNMRVLGARIVLERRREAGKTLWTVDGKRLTFSGTPEEVLADALRAHADSNARVRPTVTQRAELAAKLAANHVLGDIVIRCEASNEAEIKELIGFGELMMYLSPKVKDAIDAGKVGLTRAKKLASMKLGEQDAALVGKHVDGSDREPRPKAFPARFVQEAAKHAAAHKDVTPGEIALLAFVAGDRDALRDHKALLEVMTAAGWSLESGRVSMKVEK